MNKRTNYQTERLGISAVQLRAAELGQIWRETSTGDYGIDGHFEYVDKNGTATGRLVGVQVKSGPSYLQDNNAADYTYKPSERHRSYWEHYPIPVLLILHDPKLRKSYWADIRQQLRDPHSKSNEALTVPKGNILQDTSAEMLFSTSGVVQGEFIPDIHNLMKFMVEKRTRDAGFYVSFFELFCLGLTNICRSLYFGMDMALFSAERYLARIDSEFGVGLGHAEYDFLLDYIGFLVSQNLVHVNYSDLLIDLESREMIPTFLAPLTERGRALVGAISKMEDSNLEQGTMPRGYRRVAQEASVDIVPDTLFERYTRICQFENALLGKKIMPEDQSKDNWIETRFGELLFTAQSILERGSS